MRTNIVLNVSRQPEWLVALKRAEAELGWQPVVWITYEQNHDEVGAQFPDALKLRRLDINRGVIIPELQELHSSPLSASTIRLAQPHILTALEILDRFDLGRSMRHVERIRLIYRLLGFWLGTIQHRRIDMGIFSATPHGLGNYLLYAALKVSNKPIRILSFTALDNLTFIIDDIDSYPRKMVEAYESKLASDATVKLRTSVAESLRLVREATPDFKPWYVHNAVAREDKRRDFLDLLERSLNRLQVSNEFDPANPVSVDGVPLRKRRGQKGNVEVERTFKVPGRPFSGKLITLQEFDDYRDWAMVQKLRLRKEYETFCTPAAELSKPFIYFGLHYQPERTTCPDGGPYSDQYLCAATLSAGIPKGWQIVIKEHPSQFGYSGMGETTRWHGYYWDFLALGNVRFVSTDTSSIALIDRSEAVATVTGAVGWESLIRGKIAFHFGAVWYGFCRGAVWVRSVDDVRAALETGSLTPPTVRDIDAFAATLEAYGRSVITSPSQEDAIEETHGMADLYFELLSTDLNS